MGVRVYNNKTGISVTCDAKYWAECKDHSPQAGFALWTPNMTKPNDIPVYNDSAPEEDDSVSVDSYNGYSPDDYEIGTCSECGEEDAEIYDPENITCLDCYDAKHGEDNEPDDSWYDEDALNSVGWGNDEAY